MGIGPEFLIVSIMATPKYTYAELVANPARLYVGSECTNSCVLPDILIKLNVHYPDKFLVSIIDFVTTFTFLLTIESNHGNTSC